MTEQLKIARIGHRGDGIADTNTGPGYVPYALPGETVTVEPVGGHRDRRHLLSVDHASRERIAPVCKHFGICGGCATQHWSHAEYLLWKRNLVVESLEHAGLIAPVEPIIDAHGKGRRRATLHARRGQRDVLEVGYTAQRTHQIIGIDECPILEPGLKQAIPAAWAIAELVKPTINKPLDIHFTATGSGMDVDMRGAAPLSTKQTATMARLAEDYRFARVTRHGELVLQREQPMLKIGRASVPLPPGAFLQATAEGEAALARLVVAHIGDNKKINRVADLFCGIGTFALRLAETARVTAIDSEGSAIRSLERAVAMTSGLKAVEAQVRDLFRSPMMAIELKNYDAVVFDPPRQGAEATARELALSKVPVVVAVSCDATTFARDARMLINDGYKLVSVTPVDQFRYSHHVELVAKFTR
jgi:23S rRNA (uracil1939-C5)-methyltransferase